MKITIIYHLYNKSINLIHSLESIINQDSANYELILLCDLVDDSVFKIIQEKNIISRPNVRLIKFFENRGRSFTYNFALEKAKGNYVYFAEPKIILEKTFVSSLEKVINEYEYDYVSFLSNKIHAEYLSESYEIDMSTIDEKIKTIVNTKLSTKDKIFNRDFLIKNKIEFIPYKNFCSLYMYDILEISKKAYFLSKNLISVKREPKHKYEYNLYNILESAEILMNTLNKKNVNEKTEAYKSWIPVVILYEFIKKIYYSYFKNEKIVAKSIDNALAVLEKIYPNFKFNQYIELMLRKDIYEYIKNFDKSIKYVRKHINRF